VKIRLLSAPYGQKNMVIAADVKKQLLKIIIFRSLPPPLKFVSSPTKVWRQWYHLLNSSNNWKSL